MTGEARDIVDWVHFEKNRAELGPGFIRILCYFREDGVKSIAQIEEAMREQNTAALVVPAHTLKGESRQLGAEPLAKIAELIETTARFCVESRRFPDELVPEVVELRACSTRRSSCSTRRPTRSSAAPARAASAARSTTRASAGFKPIAHPRVSGDQRCGRSEHRAKQFSIRIPASARCPSAWGRILRAPREGRRGRLAWSVHRYRARYRRQRRSG